MVARSERNVETLISSEINIGFKLLPGAKTRSEISANDLGEILLQTIEKNR
jgi:hypothetical protein